jgi:broad specificity phosphatase PhoE
VTEAANVTQARPEPPRLTPTQRLHEVTLAALNRSSPAKGGSVEVSRNAKGDWQFDVSATADDGETLDECAARVLAVVRELEREFELSRAQHFGRDYLPNEKDAVKAKRGTGAK